MFRSRKMRVFIATISHENVHMYMKQTSKQSHETEKGKKRKNEFSESKSSKVTI